MTRPVRLRPAALSDLDALWEYGEDRWGRAAVRRYLEGLDDCLALLAGHPEIARLQTEVTPPVRLHPYRSHVIVFMAGDALDVLRIAPMRSDWRALLSD